MTSVESATDKLVSPVPLVMRPLPVSTTLLFSVASVLGYLYLLGIEHGPLARFAASQFDDSYVTYRYVANLLEGNGFVFNAGDPTNAASSFSFAMVLAITSYISGLDLPTISAFLGTISLALAGGVTAAFAFTISRTVFGAASGLIAAALVVTNPTLNYWAVSGMETAFFCLTLALAILMVSEFLTRTTKSGFLVVVTSGSLALLALTRWEGAVVAGALSLLVLVLTANRASGVRAIPIASLVPIALVLASALSLLALYQVWYGDIIPDPVRFKSLNVYYAASAQDILAFTGMFAERRTTPILWLLAFSGLIAATVASWKLRQRREARAVAVVLVALSSFFTVVLLGAYADEYRYIAPIVVPLGMLVSLNAAWVPLLTGSRRRGNVIGTLFVGGIALAASVTVLSGRLVTSEIGAGLGYLQVQESRIEMGKWLEENLPRGSRVLSGDLGALSFYNLSSTYLDAGGLANKAILTGLLRGEIYSDIVLRQDPQYLVDTATLAGVTGVEMTFDAPQANYLADRLTVQTRCSFHEAFERETLLVLPVNRESPLLVSAFSLAARGAGVPEHRTCRPFIAPLRD